MPGVPCNDNGGEGVTNEGYEGWAILELMGHRRLAGFIAEATIAGGAMLRIDVPGDEDNAPATQFYGNAAIYAITPTTEEIARALAARERPRPVDAWELSPLRRPAVLEAGTREYEDEPDDYDDQDDEGDDDPETLPFG